MLAPHPDKKAATLAAFFCRKRGGGRMVLSQRPTHPDDSLFRSIGHFGW